MNYLFTRINSIFFLIYNYFTLFTMFSYHFFFYRVTFALANAVPQTSGLVSPVSLLVWERRRKKSGGQGSGTLVWGAKVRAKVLVWDRL